MNTESQPKEWKKLFFDVALIIFGAGASTFFISTDGNGQNSVPVAAGILFVVIINGLASFFFARFSQSVIHSIAASAIVTDFLFVLYFVCRFYLQHGHEHGKEELVLLPIVFAVVTAPTVILASIGFGRIAGRFYRRNKVGIEP